MRIPDSAWKWFGTPAHFICAFDCHWHLSTLIGGHVVSTVGEHVLPRESAEAVGQKYRRNKYEDMGASAGYKYETMVFEATECSRPGCGCGEPDITKLACIMSSRAKTRKEAREMHMQFCERIAKGELPK